MLTASEIGATATAGAASAKSESVDGEAFLRELGAKLGGGDKAADKRAAALEKMANAFPGVTMSVRSFFGTAQVEEYAMRTGADSSVNISPDMMERMADDDAMFERIKEMVSQLFAAGKQQNLVNAGGTGVSRNISVLNMEVRYTEVQRNASGATLSVSSLMLESERLETDLLDMLFAGRGEGNGASSRKGKEQGFGGMIDASGGWRLQSFASMQALANMQGNQSGGAGWTSGATNALQSFSSSRMVEFNMQMTIKMWEKSGSASGMDFMSYIEMMGLCDPLVLDLGGKGIDLTSAEDGVYFDIKGDGSPVRTAFIKGENAFLYLDGNDNGIVDDAKELFGDSGGYANGFEKLRQYDDNGDGVIDEKDAIFDKLRVWRDQNGDGVNQTAESMTLAEVGVRSIDLGYDAMHEIDAHGNVIGERSAFTRYDGSQGLVADVWLRNRG